MVTIEDAFVDVWRSYRIRQGDKPDSLPDPLGRKANKSTPKSKKQRVASTRDETTETPGGFLIEEENDAGGFVIDNNGVEADDLSDEDISNEEEEVQTVPQHIPLSSIPDALASLSLPTNDNFVLDLFAQTATYLNDDVRRRRRPVGGSESGATIEKMVSLNDFERVANVLLDGNDDKVESDLSPQEDAPVSAEESDLDSRMRKDRRRPIRVAASSANKRRRKQILQEQQGEEEIASDDEDVYSEASHEEEEEAIQEYSRPTRSVKADSSKRKGEKTSTSGGLRRKRSSKSHKADTTATDENDEEEEGHLNATQRRTVHAAFRLFVNKLGEIRNEPLEEYPRLGKDDLKLLVKSVGEKIPDKEIDEMIDEGVRFFAKASSKDVTRQTAKLRRDAATGKASARGESNRAVTIGIDEFGGILLQGRLI